MLYAKVKLKAAEKTRRRLMDDGLLDQSREVERGAGYVLFPVKPKTKVKDAELVEREGRMRQPRPKSLKDSLSGILSKEEIDSLPSSYSVVGDIALLELPDELMKHKREIGEALLHTFKSIKVAAVKTREFSGEYRVPGFEVVAGEDRTETVHREHGCLYKLDVAKAYFSPRLGSERVRVAGLTKDGERDLVMFAGVGPYAILIAKTRKADVTAIELNPDAAEYMRWNVLKNRVKVDVIEGDARVETPKLGLFDRIIMPLPKQADKFMDVAIPALKRGGTIHYYTFAKNTREASDELAKTVGRLGKKAKILDAVLCGSYNPAVSRVCVDFQVE